MSASTESSGALKSGENVSPVSSGNSRRDFVGRLGFLAAASVVTNGLALNSIAKSPNVSEEEEHDFDRRALGGDRSLEAYKRRVESARAERDLPVPFHLTNGDEGRYSNRIGNYSKGLPHNSVGEVDFFAYDALLRAVHSGSPDDWGNVPLGGNTKLTNPQSGTAFDMEGSDSHQLTIPPAPVVTSAQRAGEMVEDYWMALLGDVPFTEYPQDSLAQAACGELSKLSDFRGPKENGRVTPKTLFRGFTAGDVQGPYISQFFLKPFNFGALPLTQQYQTYAAGLDYITDQNTWLAVQNGQGPFPTNQVDSQLSYLRNARGLAAWVHVDVLYQAYFNACLYLLSHGAPLNPGNPYVNSANQTGFGTFGAPHIEALLAEAATRALKAVWYQKWFVHRNERPEEFGGLVHWTKTGQRDYPLHGDVLHSEVANRVFVKTGSWFLPMAFPEGCPTHPSYGAGHATVAGACVTILKAFFDDRALLVNIGDGQIVEPSTDGLSLLPYQGADASQLTVWGELNKIAANVAIGRNMAGVHWRSDYQESLLLGEAVATSILRDQRACYTESFQGLTFHKFDGTQVTV